MGDDIKLCSWNVQGVHHPVKRKKILTSLKKEGVKIAFLQETHLKDAEHQTEASMGGSGLFFVLCLQ